MEDKNFIKGSRNLYLVNSKDLTINIKNVKDEIIKFFEKEEILILLQNMPPNKHNLLFQFLWRTGVRVSECIAIKKKDLDFTNDIITIRWLKSRKAHYRVIPIHPSLKNPLYMYSSNFNQEDRIFKYSRQRVDQLCKKYHFDHAHKIRHSFAINFLRQSSSSMALIELKELLGHRHINSTMEYLKIVPSNQTEALKRINFD